MIIRELPEGRLKVAQNSVWYIKGSRNVVLINTSGTVSHRIIYASQCGVNRFLHGNLLVKEVHVQGANKEGFIDLSPSHGKKILALELCQKEVFNIKLSSMIGFSSDISMSTIIDLGLQSVVLKRVLYQSITGPGVCLVELSGSPTWVCGEIPQIIFHPDRLISWSNEVEFEIKCGKRLMDLYLDSLYLSATFKRTGQAILLDSDRESATPTKTLLRFLRRVLLP